MTADRAAALEAALPEMIEWADARARRCEENPAWNINVERYTMLGEMLRAISTAKEAEQLASAGAWCSTAQRAAATDASMENSSPALHGEGTKG